MSGDSSTEALLVVGEPVPALSSRSDIPFLRTKLRDVKCIFSMEDVPSHLRDASHSDWNNMKKLKEIFKYKKTSKARKKTPVDVQFPFCLVKSAKTVADRLIVMSWWCSLKNTEQHEAISALKLSFRAPKVSTSPLHKRGSDRLVCGIFDTQELREEWLANSYSAQIAANDARRRTIDAPRSLSQLYDRNTRYVEESLQISTKTLLHATRRHDDASHTGYYEAVSIVVRNVATPPINGRAPSLTLPDPRVEIIARNQDALDSVSSHLGDWVRRDNTTIAFAEDADAIVPATRRRRRRKKPRISTSEETSASFLSATSLSFSEL